MFPSPVWCQYCLEESKSCYKLKISPPLSLYCWSLVFLNLFFSDIIKESHFSDLNLSLSVYRYVLISMFIRKQNLISNQEKNAIQKSKNRVQWARLGVENISVSLWLSVVLLFAANEAHQPLFSDKLPRLFPSPFPTFFLTCTICFAAFVETWTQNTFYWSFTV